MFLPTGLAVYVSRSDVFTIGAHESILTVSATGARLNNKLKLKDFAVLLLLSAGAFALHGYHPFVEDGEIYIPGIKQALNPALYPYNSEFFASHAHMTFFPQLIATSIRFSHIPFEFGLLLWQFASIFMLLYACVHVGRLLFRDPLAPWGGAALVGALLTLPVAGTALYIMDQYLTTRALSTPAILLVVLNTVERKFSRAALCMLFTVLIHPLMAVFGASYACLCWWVQSKPQELTERSFVPQSAVIPALLLLPTSILSPVTGTYREALLTRSYFF